MLPIPKDYHWEAEKSNKILGWICEISESADLTDDPLRESFENDIEYFFFSVTLHKNGIKTGSVSCGNVGKELITDHDGIFLPGANQIHGLQDTGSSGLIGVGYAGDIKHLGDSFRSFGFCIGNKAQGESCLLQFPDHLIRIRDRLGRVVRGQRVIEVQKREAISLFEQKRKIDLTDFCGTQIRTEYILHAKPSLFDLCRIPIMVKMCNLGSFYCEMHLYKYIITEENNEEVGFYPIEI